jgi:tyrosyl-tRNA synthetase
MDEPRDPFLAELHWRGLLHQTAGEGLEAHLASPPRVAYCGFDPTADSLGVGNLVPIMLMRHWQRAGHKPILLLGGATGLIGDPSGKDAERQLMGDEEVRHNVERQARIFEPLFEWEADDPARGAVLVNNLDWWQGLDYITVLRDIGKHFSVNAMIQRDSVRKRLEDRAHGISYTEFSYMLLQAYDFLHLRREHECTVQVSGSDQYGNIVSGMDLVRRAYSSGQGSEPGSGKSESFGVTAPLLTRADGKKFGKSEAGNVWLTAERTSPYAFYQFWINASDDDVGRFLKTFTLLARDEIEAILSEHEASPHQRTAQRRLAEAVTADLHGADELASVEAATAALFGKGDLRALAAGILEEVFADVPHSSHARSTLEGEGIPLADLLPETSLANSKREAREFLKNNAVSVNGERADADRRLRVDDLLHGKVILLKRGKKNWHASHWTG